MMHEGLQLRKSTSGSSPAPFFGWQRDVLMWDQSARLCLIGGLSRGVTRILPMPPPKSVEFGLCV